jgi:protoheme IX farnesyltransferase
LFVLLAWPVLRNRSEDPAAMQPERRLFKFSILYLFGLFAPWSRIAWVAA